MATADTYVRARIDSATKVRAEEALEAMGLSVSDAIRLLMVQVANERRLPFAIQAPNTATLQARKELEAGHGARFSGVEALMADLHADD
jgi:DNA-damage-inducible protein J